MLPTLAAAHEVYVLDGATVARAMAGASPNPFTAYIGNEYDFFFWAFVGFVLVSTILFASFYRVLEPIFGSTLATLKRYAHPVVRVTVGLSFISFGLVGELFGHEIAFVVLFGALTPLLEIVAVAIGAAILFGFHTRIAALLGLGIYAYAWTVFDWYMLTYTDHLGALLLLFVLGGGTWSLDRAFRMGQLPLRLKHLARALRPYAFPALRILFGFGIMFASVYAKFIHSELALQVVYQYHLTNYFPFDPLFIVLGALIVEFVAGLFLVIGFEIRWTSLFLLFWLTLSLLYFQEAIWPHIILFGGGIALFLHGYDTYSLEGFFLKRHGHEPVL
jgi:uncharacterized membrane protein YphA (DoxX/SURF4 family)